MQDSYTLLRQRQKLDNSQTSTELESTPLLKRLHYYHELDEWQQDNHFIKSVMSNKLIHIKNVSNH